MTADLRIITVDQQDPRLGRQVVHDPASRRFAFPRQAALVRPKRRIRLRTYGPRPLPRQAIGCCSGVDQAVKANTVGVRKRGRVLTLDDAVAIYSRATQLDPWDGEYLPTDTGSSGLAACKASVERGLIVRYEWLFGGAAQVLAAVEAGHPVGIGTWWYADMFDPDPQSHLVRPGGARVGGHQWTVLGWEPKLGALAGLCWWGDGFGDRGRFYIRLEDLDELLADDGDAHVVYAA